MDPLTMGLISSGIGLVGSLFGKKKRRAPEPPKPDPAMVKRAEEEAEVARTLRGTMLKERGYTPQGRFSPLSSLGMALQRPEFYLSIAPGLLSAFAGEQKGTGALPGILSALGGAYGEMTGRPSTEQAMGLAQGSGNALLQAMRPPQAFYPPSQAPESNTALGNIMSGASQGLGIWSQALQGRQDAAMREKLMKAWGMA